MAPMLPAPRGDIPSLADVLTGSFSALQGQPNRLALPSVRSAAVILVDGLGMGSLSANSGHARRLLSAIPRRGGVIESAFPTTTAAALATLTTGASAGEHGLVGYRSVDPDADRVVALLRDWDSTMVPGEWQRRATVFEWAARAGVDPVVVGAERYRSTGFTEAVLRGARFTPARSIIERVETAIRLLDGGERRLVYAYIPELDMAGHAHGVDSDAWRARLDELDGALAMLDSALPRDAGVLLTADHGMLDIPAHRRIVVAADSPVWAEVRHVAGEPRCLHLGLHNPSAAVRVRDRWREAEGDRAWVVTRDEAVAAGWFGKVDPHVLPRIGDVLVAARAAVAYYDERSATAQSLAMVGQHGSFSPDETRIPLARWGAFA